MVTNCTLVRVRPARDKTVYLEVKKFPDVKDAVLTYGENDIILEVEVESLERLDSFIFGKLRIFEGRRGDDTPDRSQANEGARRRLGG